MPSSSVCKVRCRMSVTTNPLTGSISLRSGVSKIVWLYFRGADGQHILLFQAEAERAERHPVLTLSACAFPVLISLPAHILPPSSNTTYQLYVEKSTVLSANRKCISQTVIKSDESEEVIRLPRFHRFALFGFVVVPVMGYPCGYRVSFWR